MREHYEELSKSFSFTSMRQKNSTGKNIGKWIKIKEYKTETRTEQVSKRERIGRYERGISNSKTIISKYL